MNFFKNLSIKKKLVVIIAMSSTISLLLATTVLALAYLIKVREELVRELSMVSNIIAKNSSKAIVYDDAGGMADILSSLKANSNIDYAILYNQEGNVLSVYKDAAEESALESIPNVTSVQRTRYHFTGEFLSWFQPIYYNEEKIGVLYLRYELSEIRDQIRNYGLALVGTLIASIFIGLVISRGLRNIILKPILDLFLTTRKISKSKDYSLRLRNYSEDEIGVLIQSFNEMLSEIQKRDIKLEKYSEELENQVNARTSELIESNRQLMIFRKFAENAGQGLCIALLNYESVYLNPAYRRLVYEKSISEAIGKPILRYYSDEVARKIKNEILPLVLETGQWTGELSMVTLQGKVIPTIVNFFAINDETSRPLYLACLITDITETKNTEQILRRAKEEAENLNKQLALAIGEAERQTIASQAKSEFLANMSHEIRTPMNAVMGMAALLMDTDLNAVQRDFVETIRQSSEALLGIINDILDLSKIESGMMELSNRSLDIYATIDEVMDLFAVQANQKGLELLYFVHKDVPQYIIGDATRLRQILVNLVGNAIKFTESGIIYLGVSIATTSKDNCHLQFVVQDTGIGIHRDKINKLFKPFSQVDSSRTRRFGGTGLGLSISKRLAEMMNGTMWVESIPGEGSAFYFTVTAKVNYDSNPVPLQNKKMTGKSLLLVLPQDRTAEVMSSMLEKNKIRSARCSSGQEAIEMLSSDKTFDGVLISSVLSDMEGISLAKKIRGLELFNDLPLVLYSSIGDSKIRNDIHNFKNAYLMSQPLKEGVLLKTLTEAFATTKATYIKEAIFLSEEDTQENKACKILLVEDNKVNQKVGLLLLTKMGYSADVANNGLEALEVIKKHDYDVIYMDMQMPVMDGVEATKKIRKYCYENDKNQPYIIALTAGATIKDREACLECGMNDFITKPIKVEELKESLNKRGR